MIKFLLENGVSFLVKHRSSVRQGNNIPDKESSGAIVRISEMVDKDSQEIGENTEKGLIEHDESDEFPNPRNLSLNDDLKDSLTDSVM